MTGNSFPRIYDAGSLQVSAKVLSDFGLDPLSSELMLRLGLPSKLPGEMPLVQFETPQRAVFDGEELSRRCARAMGTGASALPVTRREGDCGG